jgi:NAD(P)H-flavin reductase
MPSVAYYKGRIVEILLEGYQNAAAILSCPERAAPRPGQYLQAHQPHDPMEVVPVSLFAGGDLSRGARELGRGGEVSISVAGPIPASWEPGTEVLLRGPLGKGFELPKRARRIALAAFNINPARLLPLVSQGIQQGAGMVLFGDSASSNLHLAVEQHSLSDLASGLKWADYLAADIATEEIDELPNLVASRIPAALAAEILVATPMPCGGMAKCGVCTVRTKKGPRLACEDGPVFDLKEIV